MTYTCNKGYQRLASATVTCQASGSWSTRPSCGGEQCMHESIIYNYKLIYKLYFVIIAVSCGSPPSISNGSPGTPTRTTFGGTVTYTCNTVYQRSGSAAVTCEASGSWSTRPSCNGVCIIIAIIYRARQSRFLVSHQLPLVVKSSRLDFHYCSKALTHPSIS